MQFFIADAFADRLFGGNPAGVVLLPSDREDLPEETMRLVAAELRYSETAFVRALGENRFHLRYFTPAAEVDLCGHATIASFYVLQQAGLLEEGREVIAQTLAGSLSILVSGDKVFMEMAEGKALEEIRQPDQLKELYGVLGLPVHLPDLAGKRLYPQPVSTGLMDILLPLESREQLAAIKPDFPALAELSRSYGVTGVHAFVSPQGEGPVYCRNFAPLYDIDEEAATGTSNGALTFYLHQRDYIEEGKDKVFIQGEAMGRPSQIISRLQLQEGKVRIFVGGSAAVLAEGTMNI